MGKILNLSEPSILIYFPELLSVLRGTIYQGALPMSGMKVMIMMIMAMSIHTN